MTTILRTRRWLFQLWVALFVVGQLCLDQGGCYNVAEGFSIITTTTITNNNYCYPPTTSSLHSSSSANSNSDSSFVNKQEKGQEQEEEDGRNNSSTILNPQATWEDIGRNLLNLRSVGVPDEILMTTRLDIPNLNKVCVQPSLVGGGGEGGAAGRGLFATQDIMKGEIVTCYPGDILLQPSGLTGVPDYLQKDDELLRSMLTKYSIGIKDGYAIMGLPDRCDDMAYAGHLINDGISQPPTCTAELQAYITESNNKANIEHSPLENIHMVSIAKRNIQAGEELYVFYGPIYWMDHKETWNE